MKLGTLSIIIGIFLIRSDVENLVTNWFPGNSEIWIGVVLIFYGLYRMSENNFNFKKIWRFD